MNLFRRIDEIHRDAAEELRRMFLSEANLARVKEGRALLEELRLYYTGTVDSFAWAATRPQQWPPEQTKHTQQHAPEQQKRQQQLLRPHQRSRPWRVM